MTSLKPSSGEKTLSVLISTLITVLHPSTFVFATIPKTTSLNLPLLLPKIQLLFQDSEGTTLILNKDDAITHDLDYQFECRMITLDIHSSLQAVGFMAEITRVLAERGMGVNPVSGFFHDHLFVAVGCEEEALAALEKLAVGRKRELEGRR